MRRWLAIAQVLLLAEILVALFARRSRIYVLFPPTGTEVMELGRRHSVIGPTYKGDLV